MYFYKPKINIYSQLQLNMEVINLFQNSKISPNLQQLKFMKGFAAAKTFLLQLKNIKEQDVDKKPQNSLAFSPIVQHSSIASQQNTGRDTGRAPQNHTARESRPPHKEEKKEVNVEYLKNQINIQAKILNQQYSELVYMENAIQVLAQNLRRNAPTFKRIQQYKHQQRQKNIRLLALKSSVDKKKMMLEECIKRKQKFMGLLRSAVKDYLIDQHYNFGCEVVPHFAKEISIKHFPQIEDQDPDIYPSKLKLKYKTTKKKEKQRKKDQFVSQQSIKDKSKDKTVGLIQKINNLGMGADSYYDNEYVD